MSFRVRLTPDAERDLLELYDFLLERDLSAAEAALSALRRAFELLEHFPHSCRPADPAGRHPSLREMIVPFGRAGYVVLFEIEDRRRVTVLAVRHQREDDYH